MYKFYILKKYKIKLNVQYQKTKNLIHKTFIENEFITKRESK